MDVVVVIVVLHTVMHCSSSQLCPMFVAAFAWQNCIATIFVFVHESIDWTCNFSDYVYVTLNIFCCYIMLFQPSAVLFW